MGGGSDRYFNRENMSIKCTACYAVGHREKECPNISSIHCCHLCAGKDHDAVDCPNLTCFRCGLFGHHSRNCVNPRSGKPTICSNCGSLGHDLRKCSDRYSALPDRGSNMRCMSCKEIGHLNCKYLPSLRDKRPRIYCPNCGQEGHHADYPDPFGPGCY